MDPQPGISQTLHYFLSKDNSKYQHYCTHIFPHLASLFRKHKMPFDLLDNPWRTLAPSWTHQSSKLAWLSTWRAGTHGYPSSIYSSRGFCTCLKPLKYSTYFEVELPLWSSSSWAPHVITQMRDSQQVAREQIYPLQIEKKRITMQENEKRKDTIQGGYMKRGMFMSIWLYNWCQLLNEIFSIIINTNDRTFYSWCRLWGFWGLNNVERW